MLSFCHTHRVVMLTAWVEETFLYFCREPRLIQSHHLSPCWDYLITESSILKCTSVSSPARPRKDDGRGDRNITSVQKSDRKDCPATSRTTVAAYTRQAHTEPLRLPAQDRHTQSHCSCPHKTGTHRATAAACRR